MKNLLKKFFLVTLGLVMLFSLTAVPALAENTAPVPSEKQLIVQGSSTITLTADYASLNLGVNTKGATVEEAHSANNAVMEKIIAAIKEQGVEDKDIVTSSFNVYPIYNYEYNKLSDTETVSGYQVDNMLMVTVRDISKVSQIMDAAMASGANQSYGINFGSSKQAQAYDTALQEAVKEGIRKAELLAAASGKKLGELVKMEEKENSYSTYAPSAKYEVADAAAGTPILSGEITVYATTTLTYLFE